MSLLLKNCKFVVTQDSRRRILRDYDILIEENRISEIGKTLQASDEVLDCSKSLVMPGLINTHTHIAMTQFRGVADDVTLEEFLEKTYKLDSQLKKGDVYKGALLGCIESIRFGTTTFNDLYYSEDEIARAVEKTGIRANLSWAVLDKEFTTQRGDPVNNCRGFIREWKGKNDRIAVGVGIQGVYVSSRETYLRALDIAEEYDTKTHTHLSETRREVYDCVKREGKRPVEWLEEIGFLNERLTAAHCVWITKREMDILSKRGINVSHNPTSNLKLASGGLAPVPELLERGVNITIGTDGCASNNNLDVFKEMKLAAILHKNAKWNATLVPAQTALDMATVNGARALGIDAGSIEVGKLADVIVVGLRKPHLIPMREDNIVSNIVYSMEGGDVDSVIINGEVVMKDGVIRNGFKIMEMIEK